MGLSAGAARRVDTGRREMKQGLFQAWGKRELSGGRCPRYRASGGCLPLPRAVDLAPAARGQQRPDAGAEQGKYWSQYSFALVSRTDNRRRRTIVINRNSGAESAARSNRCPDQRVFASAAVRFDGNPPNRVAGDTAIYTSGAQHQRILRGRLKT